MSALLQIDNLHVAAQGKKILQGISLQLQPGQVYAIMGPNGSGKSTLVQFLAGRPGYEMSQGTVTYQGEDLTVKNAEERARAGIFLAFQYPVELTGVNNAYFLKAAVNARRQYLQQQPYDAIDFLSRLKKEMHALSMPNQFLERAVNVGFSGGEKKRNEILQMALLEPNVALLDETDSGLDIDAMRIVAAGINRLRSPERAIVLVTHYQRLLDYVEPDSVHVLAEGKIVHSGDKAFAHKLEEHGYGFIKQLKAV